MKSYYNSAHRIIISEEQTVMNKDEIFMASEKDSNSRAMRCLYDMFMPPQYHFQLNGS